MQNHDDADEKAGEKDDVTRAADALVHLVEKILEIVRAAEKICKGASGEEGVFLNVGDKLQRAVREHVKNRDFVFPPRLLSRHLERRVGHLSLFRDLSATHQERGFMEASRVVQKSSRKKRNCEVAARQAEERGAKIEANALLVDGL